MKSAGIFLVGAAVPAVEGDLAAIEAIVRQSLVNYAPVLPQTGLDRVITALIAAGMTPSRASSYLTRALTSGNANATPYTGGVPVSALPALPIDVDTFAKATEQRLGAAYTPQHDVFIRQHLRASFDKNIGLSSLHNQTARTICQLIASATGQTLPAGL